MSTASIQIRSSEIVSDPGRLIREMKAGNTVNIPDMGYTVVPTGDVRDIARVVVAPYGDYDEAEEDMVSLRTNRTGVDNTIFVSTRGNAQHAPRIKIAVDPPDSLNASCKSTSMAIHDYSTVGEYLPTPLVEQVKSFIERNREILQRYWNYEIDTDQLFKGLADPKGPRIEIG